MTANVMLLQEDELIMELVKKHGPRQWSLIASHLKGRIGKQCRERYKDYQLWAI